MNKSEIEYAISLLEEENKVSGARFSTLRAIIVLKQIVENDQPKPASGDITPASGAPRPPPSAGRDPEPFGEIE